MAGPGHGGPAVVANVYLEGAYSEVYPGITQDERGMRALFRQFSTPGGIPSHVGPATPGSIHEGGELGYVAAREHCAKGASRWAWASHDEGTEPDIVLGCAGDVATLETIAAAAWLREHAPELHVRVVNVVDLMTLASPTKHAHGMPDERFVELFTADTDVIFAFHGYPGAIHQIVHGRSHASRFHVRGYQEEGSTTTPFDMVVLNAHRLLPRDARPTSSLRALALRGHARDPRFSLAPRAVRSAGSSRSLRRARTVCVADVLRGAVSGDPASSSLARRLLWNRRDPSPRA